MPDTEKHTAHKPSSFENCTLIDGLANRHGVTVHRYQNTVIGQGGELNRGSVHIGSQAKIHECTTGKEIVKEKGASYSQV